MKGYIVSDNPYDNKLHASAFNNLHGPMLAHLNMSSPHNFTTLPHDFPEGANNKFISNITYEFGMSSFKVGLLTMTDASNERYSIPEVAVNKPSPNPTMKLDMIGLKIFSNPFSF